jgi:hypothetical protein
MKSFCGWQGAGQTRARRGGCGGWKSIERKAGKSCLNLENSEFCGMP